MKFVITEHGLIPEKHKDTFDPFWGKTLFHDYFEHFFEGDFIFKDELYENLIGELATIGSSYYFILRGIGNHKVKKLNEIVFVLCEEVYILCISKRISNKYSTNFEKFKKLNFEECNYKCFKIISTIVLDKIKKYKPEVFELLDEDFENTMCKAMSIGYYLCENKFKNVATKHIYNLLASLERLKNKSPKWFYDNFKSAEIITNKKQKIKLKFYK